MTEKAMTAATLCLHAGETERRIGAPLPPPPVPATSFFSHPDAMGFSANDLAGDAPHFYTRWSNPTLQLLETRLAALEGGGAAVSFASGMAAVSALFVDRPLPATISSSRMSAMPASPSWRMTFCPGTASK
jgi:cystathionine gamma-synthase/methionine-gamma-lyase